MTSDTIRLPAWLSTGMIFQQGVSLLLYGYAMPHIPVKLEVVKDPTDGRKVSKLDTEYGIIWSKETRSDDNGKFSFEMPAYKPSSDAYTFVFTALDITLQVKDLRCGDVWIMLGSTPLSVPISKAGAPRTPLKDSALHLIRFFISSRTGIRGGESYSYAPVSDLYSASWITAGAGRALAGVSSAGFSLAYHLADQLHYPVGIVDLALEGSAIYSWISRRTIESDMDLAALLRERRIFLDESDWDGKDSCEESGVTAPAAEPKAPLYHPAHPVNGNRMILSEIPKTHSDKKVEPLPDILPERRMTALYNHKLHPLKGMSIRGIIFSPDEKDSVLADRYQALLSALLSDMSELFGPHEIRSRKCIPSLILLLPHPSCTDPSAPYRLLKFGEELSAIRRKLPMPIGVLSQHDMLLPDKAMTFYIGRRLSSIALGLHFTPKMPTSSPECVGVEIIGNKVMISFDNTGDGLKLAENESVLRGFSVCGKDKVYRPAQAKILHGVRVMVWHDDIHSPTGVTYGYNPIPHDATFRNRADLPVLPFRFDRGDASYAPDLTFASCDHLTFIGLEKMDSEFSLLPVYRIIRGEGQIFLETLNKTEGSGSLRIEYAPEEGRFTFAPILSYASLFAPLDLSSFRHVCIDIFNPDLQDKNLSISGFEGKARISQGLMWQTVELAFPKDKPMKLSSFEITLSDLQQKGSLYIDNIRFRP